MKYVVVLVVGILAGAAGLVWYLLSDYSEGYRMGTLSAFERDGYLPYLKSGEGQMLLGRESSPLAVDYTTSDGYKVPREFNPWKFSANQADITRFEALVGKVVWIGYRQHRYNLSLLRETDYEALEVFAAADAAVIPPAFEVKKAITLGRAEGVRAGRIVKASARGKLINTWEIVLQVGEAGNHFKPMSVDDGAMYDYAVKCLKSGRQVRVHYVDKGALKLDFNDTPYEVWKIEDAGK